MKIAVVHNLPAGGQKRALCQQLKLLSKSHHFDLFTLTTANEKFLPLRKFVNTHYEINYNYPDHFPLSVFSIYFRLPTAYKLLADKINKGGYNLAYVNPCFLTQAPYILRYLKIPSLYACAEPKREFYEDFPHVSNKITYKITYPFRWPVKVIDRLNAKRASRILVNSQYSKLIVDRAYQVDTKINYLGVDIAFFKPLTLKKENIVLTVGNFSLHKGHDFIIRSLSKIPSQNRPKLVIIGQAGVEKNYLLKLASSLDINLQLFEDISEEKLLIWYNKAQIFVYATINEPFGLVLLEAAACGLPIVAVDEGGVSEIITSRKIGTLVKRSQDDFAQAVNFYLNHPYSKTEVNNLTSYIKNNWNWEKSVRELERHFSDIAL